MKANQNIQILSNYTIQNWSGGTTTELFMHPLNSRFKDRDFDFRLSTATVEVEESTFTSLSNISRTLMVLDGKMTLIHKSQHKKELKKFDVDIFEGDWNTKSIGKCVDFNLMTRGKTKGTLEAFILDKDDRRIFLTNSNFLFLYLYKGEIKYNLDKKSNELKQGELLCLTGTIATEIQLNCIGKSEVIVCRIMI